MVAHLEIPRDALTIETSPVLITHGFFFWGTICVAENVCSELLRRSLRGAVPNCVINPTIGTFMNFLQSAPDGLKWAFGSTNVPAGKHHKTS
jgi:hypothetical protein